MQNSTFPTYAYYTMPLFSLSIFFSKVVVYPSKTPQTKNFAKNYCKKAKNVV